MIDNFERLRMKSAQRAGCEHLLVLNDIVRVILMSVVSAFVHAIYLREVLCRIQHDKFEMPIP